MVVTVAYTCDGADARIGQGRPASPVLRLHASEDCSIPPQGRALVHTGIRMALPIGFAGLATPSGEMAAGCGLMLANAPGLIDSGYRGEVCGIAFNPSREEPIAIRAGDQFMDLSVTRTINGGESPCDEEEAMGETVLQVRVIEEGLDVPAYAHDDDNGLDLRSAEDCTIAPLGHRMVRLGIGVALAEGFHAQLQPRSGLSLKAGLTVIGSPVVLERPSLDEELSVVLANLDPDSEVSIHKNDRIAQLVILRDEQVELVLVDDLDETDRGAGGFGSSGK